MTHTETESEASPVVEEPSSAPLTDVIASALMPSSPSEDQNSPSPSELTEPEQAAHEESQVTEENINDLKSPTQEAVDPTEPSTISPDASGLDGSVRPEEPEVIPEPQEATPSEDEGEGTSGLTDMFGEMRRCFKDDFSPDRIVGLADALDLRKSSYSHVS
jgi:hypothetical protein